MIGGRPRLCTVADHGSPGPQRPRRGPWEGTAGGVGDAARAVGGTAGGGAPAGPRLLLQPHPAELLAAFQQFRRAPDDTAQRIVHHDGGDV